MSEEIIEGSKAPDFELQDQNGANISLSDLKGQWVVLYFYPKDNTPGCTKEACDFRDHNKTFEKKGIKVLGVSSDDAKSHQKFIGKFNINFPLLCDVESKVSRTYGTYKKKSLYGRNFWGIERSTFIIDPSGKLKKIFRKVKVDGHTRDVMDAIN